MEESFTLSASEGHGGSRLLKEYQDSFVDILKAIYPQYSWNGFWKDPVKHEKEFVEWLGKQIGIKRLEDWHAVKRREVIEHGGAELLKKYSSRWSNVLNAVFPEHNWLPFEFEYLLYKHEQWKEERI